jgi:di/tricarboxylate transporter
MNLEVAFMLIVVLAALVAFVKELFPIEVTALGLLAILVVTGTIDVGDALAGFSSTAVVAIGSLFVLSHALTKTGLLETVADRIGNRADDRPWPMMVLLLILVCIGSAFLNNTAVVALSIPLVMKLCRRLGLSASKVLLPMSYASILGGTLTLIGTSTNLLVSSVVEKSSQPPLGMFEFTILGTILAAVGLIYIVIASRSLLPARADKVGLTEKYRVGAYLTELMLGEDSKLVGHNVSERNINEQYNVTVLEVIHGPSEIHLEDVEMVLLRPKDVLIVQGEMEDILRFQRDQQLTLLPDVKLTDDELAVGDQALVEAWVAPGSRMIGRTLKQLDFHHRHGAFVLAVHRRRSTLRKRIADIIMRSADALLILIPRSRIAPLEETRDVVVFSEREFFIRRERRWWLVLVVLPLVILAAASGLLDIAAGALVGAIVLLMFGVMTPNRAYRAVDWSVVFMIAAFVPVGHAFQVTGTADYLARALILASTWAPSDLAPHVVLALVFFITSVLTQVASNNAAAVVFAPIALSLGPALGVDSRPFIFAVCFAASAAFMTPMGYQTNLMVHAAGEYRFMDYVRFGAPLYLLVWVLATIFIPVIWPFS